MDEGRRFRIQKSLLYLNIVYAVSQNEVDQLVAGVIGFRRQIVQLGQNVLSYADGNDAISIFASLFDDKGFSVHVLHLAI